MNDLCSSMMTIVEICSVAGRFQQAFTYNTDFIYLIKRFFSKRKLKAFFSLGDTLSIN